MRYLMKTQWWKWLCMGMLIYTIIGGLLLPVPKLPILNETIRLLHFHVPMWFGMTLLFLGSSVYAIKYLRNPDPITDVISFQLANAGLLLGCLGIASGMLWARSTWGAFWVNDPKLNGSAISLLIYLAYFVLRNSFKDEQSRNKTSAVYNILAFSMTIPLIFILPRLTDSLHPGNGGNPGFNTYDMNNDLRKVFYFAVLGWTLLGVWIATISTRISFIKQLNEDA